MSTSKNSARPQLCHDFCTVKLSNYVAPVMTALQSVMTGLQSVMTGLQQVDLDLGDPLYRSTRTADMGDMGSNSGDASSLQMVPSCCRESHGALLFFFRLDLDRYFAPDSK